MLRYIVLLTAEPAGQPEKLKKQCDEKQIHLCSSLPEEETLISETLYITDDGFVARRLMEEKANVLVWLNEHNKMQSFDGIPYAVENLEEADLTYMERVWCRFQKLPWEITETARCLIREMTLEDLDAIYHIYSGKNITKYMEGLYEDREQEREYMKCYIENEYTFWGYGTWLVERKEDNRVIGRVGFNMREGFEEPELGFVIGEEYQRQGYAFECCRAVLEIGKQEYEFDRVQALVKEGNEASINLCEKLGFQFVSTTVVQEEEYRRYCRIY